MDLDPIEAGLQRVLRALPIGIDHAGNLAGLERPRRLIGHGLSVSRHRLEVSRNRHRRWRDRQRAAGLERGVRNTPDMPELQKNHSALGMNGIDDLAPALDLMLGIDAGNAWVS